MSIKQTVFFKSEFLYYILERDDFEMVTKKDFSQWDSAINYDPANNTIKPPSLSKYIIKIASSKLHRVLMIIMIITWLYIFYKYYT
jgi:hypothetical protein